MSRFIQDTQSLYALENYRLFSRIFAGLLLGNTDMHLKNFAMFHTYEGLKLTPSYDQVAAALYGYKTVALKFEKGNYMQIDRLKSRHLFKLAQAFGLSKEMFFMIAEKLKNNKEAAFEAIASSEHGAKSLKNKLIKLVDARCNSIG
jgi:serine/threonine-protein kinase HipA